MALTKNKAVLDWIDDQAALTQPDQIVWIDGSEAQLEELRAQIEKDKEYILKLK